MFMQHLLCVDLALAAGDTVVSETDPVPAPMETREEDLQSRKPRNKSNVINCNTVCGRNEHDLVVGETYFVKVKEGCEV